MNKAQLNLTMKRISAGKYLFGSKTISAKIVNGNLLIRVGGGYLSFEEFIKQYAPNELVKLNANESLNQSLGSSLKKHRMSMGDFKKLKIDISAQITPNDPHSARKSFNLRSDPKTLALNSSNNEYGENLWEKV